jgi:hypothetical protein
MTVVMESTAAGMVARYCQIGLLSFDSNSRGDL